MNRYRHLWQVQTSDFSDKSPRLLYFSRPAFILLSHKRSVSVVVLKNLAQKQSHQGGFISRVSLLTQRRLRTHSSWEICLLVILTVVGGQLYLLNESFAISSFHFRRDENNFIQSHIYLQRMCSGKRGRKNKTSICLFETVPLGPGYREMESSAAGVQIPIMPEPVPHAGCCLCIDAQLFCWWRRWVWMHWVGLSTEMPAFGCQHFCRSA